MLRVAKREGFDAMRALDAEDKSDAMLRAGFAPRASDLVHYYVYNFHRDPPFEAKEVSLVLP